MANCLLVRASLDTRNDLYPCYLIRCDRILCDISSGQLCLVCKSWIGSAWFSREVRFIRICWYQRTIHPRSLMRLRTSARISYVCMRCRCPGICVNVVSLPGSIKAWAPMVVTLAEWQRKLFDTAIREEAQQGRSGRINSQPLYRRRVSWKWKHAWKVRTRHGDTGQGVQSSLPWHQWVDLCKSREA